MGKVFKTLKNRHRRFWLGIYNLINTAAGGTSSLQIVKGLTLYTHLDKEEINKVNVNKLEKYISR